MVWPLKDSTPPLLLPNQPEQHPFVPAPALRKGN